MQQMKLGVLGVLVILIAALFLGFLGSFLRLDSSAMAQDFVGEGKWYSRSGQTMGGTWTAALKQSDTEVSGEIQLTGSTLFGASSVTGTIDGQEIAFGMMSEGAQQVTFSGKFDGESVAGEWSLPAMNDRGVWEGTLRTREGGS
jgi:hypothetical protein